jgi:hypothetical protein
MLEAIAYVVMGFAGTLAAMETAWRIAKKHYSPAVQAAKAA